MKYCCECGAPNNDSAKYCERCGTKFRSLEQEAVKDINEAADQIRNDAAFTGCGQTHEDTAFTGSDQIREETAYAGSGQTQESAAAYDAEKEYRDTLSAEDFTAQTASAGTAAAASESAASETAGGTAAADAPKSDNSVLSIVAFVLSFFIPPVGLILSIIDLCIPDGRKKGLSIAGLVISICFTLIIVVALVLPISFILGLL